jgi:site-specific recombinase XerC
MAEKDALLQVCMEPLLYAFQAPRTIATTLKEYEQHLLSERGLSPARVHATLRTLARLLDPIEAPLVSLTPELARTLAHQETERHEGVTLGNAPERCLSVKRAQSFFGWALRRGFVNRNPFEDFTIAVSMPAPAEEQTSWLA